MMQINFSSKLPNTLKSLSLIALMLLSFSAGADSMTHKSPYAGQETRTIKSLSVDDISQLNEGKGWGLAKVAELNGVPGPSHLLEMKKEIKLSSHQIQKITTIYKKMKSDAILFGSKLISLEKELNEAFRKKSINRKSLKNFLSSIEMTRKELRYVHLVAHLESADVVTEHQIARYNKLRGYSSNGGNDPCNNIPSGHDKEMWLQHNNCN